MRLAKFLSSQGIASRRKAEELISEGRVTLNGDLVEQQGVQIDPNTDQIAVDGKPVVFQQREPYYYALHKPVGYLVSRESQGGQPTIFDLPSVQATFSQPPLTAGRLDLDTSGLLFLSNDGDWVHRLSHPSFGIAKVYEVVLNRRIERVQHLALKRGVVVDDRAVEPVEAISLPGKYRYKVTLHEGRKRIVRRLFEAVDLRVLQLHRSQVGDYVLAEDHAPGELKSVSLDQRKRCYLV